MGRNQVSLFTKLISRAAISIPFASMCVYVCELYVMGTINMSVFFFSSIYSTALYLSYYGLRTILEAEERKINKILYLKEQGDVSRHILEVSSLCQPNI